MRGLISSCRHLRRAGVDSIGMITYVSTGDVTEACEDEDSSDITVNSEGDGNKVVVYSKKCFVAISLHNPCDGPLCFCSTILKNIERDISVMGGNTATYGNQLLTFVTNEKKDSSSSLNIVIGSTSGFFVCSWHAFELAQVSKFEDGDLLFFNENLVQPLSECALTIASKRKLSAAVGLWMKGSRAEDCANVISHILQFEAGVSPNYKGTVLNLFQVADMISVSANAGLSFIKEEPKLETQGYITAYNFFCSSNRDLLFQEFPSLNANEINSLLGDKWKSSTMQQRKYYEFLASQDKLRYLKEITTKNESGSVHVPRINPPSGYNWDGSRNDSEIPKRARIDSIQRYCTAYNHFVIQERHVTESMQSEGDRSKAFSERWRLMPESERDQYFLLSNADYLDVALETMEK